MPCFADALALRRTSTEERGSHIPQPCRAVEDTVYHVPLCAHGAQRSTKGIFAAMACTLFVCSYSHRRVDPLADCVHSSVYVRLSVWLLQVGLSCSAGRESHWRSFSITTQ